MNHVLKKIAAFGLICGGCSTANAVDTADLYCVNAEDINQWYWAKWSDVSQQLKNEWGAVEQSGVYVALYGRAGNYASDGFTVVGLNEGGIHTFAYCDGLINICTSQFGEKFRYVGVGGSWFKVNYFDLNNNLQSCPSRDLANIKTSSSVPGSNVYQVECLDPVRGSTTFQLNNERSNNEWSYWFSDKGLTYKTPTPDLNLEIIDADVGMKYCTGKPSDQ